MKILQSLQPQYITDAEGNKISVIISLQVFQELLENLEDLAAIAERRDEPTTSQADLLAELKQDGLI